MTFSTDHFVKRYFEAVKSEILSDKNDAIFSVKVPIDVDKELTHRPYYWMYLESLGKEPVPSIMNFAFDPSVEPPEDVDCELITMGSIRFHNILNSARRRGKIGRLYQYFPPRSRLSRSSLRPYLLINMRVSLIADKTQDHLYSLGINLQTGQLYRNFYNNVTMFPLTEVKPHDSLLGEATISLKQAIAKMEEDLCQYVTETDNKWAQQARITLDEEVKQIESYYKAQIEEKEQLLQLGTQKVASDTEFNQIDYKQMILGEIGYLEYEKKQRIDEVHWQFSPRVEISPYSMVMVYMV
ncbi:YqhG family protein [Desulfuribacillus alkaliarsenatis]|uniref:Uncharacterized protein n=1 Tax=Desulfuribacillus alkaliarsenatis TaxID=766136 RepID=A0A1E5G6P2_9FIRM|nr:YqhG family protein [Desulfuribacillus alkaliarsenatis]OEF98414.1 hypothetical protein BHF68_01680 [Desulfuribacillus alkaliarsenatis]